MDKQYSLEFKNESISDFISVIIPVYQDVDGLADTLNSLQQQTLAYDKYQIIVVNDGGDKDIRNICNDYSVTVVDIIPNQGSYNARNRGLSEACGDKIAFIDADITAPEKWLETGSKLLDRSDYAAGNVLIDRKMVNNLAASYEYQASFPVAHYLSKDHFGPTANIFVKREVIERIGGFDKRLRSGGDREFGDRVYHSGFKQTYSPDISVIHPPRNYKNLIKKLKRTTKGHSNLCVNYPNRFEKLKLGVILKHLFLPPRPSSLNKRKNIYNIIIKFFFSGG